MSTGRADLYWRYANGDVLSGSVGIILAFPLSFGRIVRKLRERAPGLQLMGPPSLV